eukprot:5138007-Amphidinium_carterae.1
MVVVAANVAQLGMYAAAVLCSTVGISTFHMLTGADHKVTLCKKKAGEGMVKMRDRTTIARAPGPRPWRTGM